MIEKFLLGMLLASLTMGPGLAGGHPPRQTTGRLPCHFVATNEIKNGERRIKVMMNESDFSPEGLRNLMTRYFQQYSEPERMWVDVDTDRSQFFQAFYLAKRIGGGDATPEWTKHPTAGLFRREGNEFIRYLMPGDAKWTTIVMKGTVQ